MTRRVFVADTSVIVKWLNRENEKYLDQSDKLFANGREGKLKLIAPELAKYEIGNALLNKRLTLPESKLSLATIYTIPIKFVILDHKDADDTLEIAHAMKITFYDASFIALAKRFNATLITDNPKHQKQIDGARVISLEDY